MSKPPKRAAAKSAGKGGAGTADEPGSGSGARAGAPSLRVALPTAQEPPDGTDAPQRTPKKAAAGKMSARKTGAKKTGVGKAGIKKAGVKKTSVKKTGLKKNTEKVAARKGGASKTVRRAVRSGSAVLRTATLDGATAGVLDRLFEVVTLRRDADPNISHSARLLSRGTAKVAQKFGEEAVECLIEAVAGNSAKLIGESADVLYHLIVMWVDAGVQPSEIWTELQRREGTSGIAEKAARGTTTRATGE